MKRATTVIEGIGLVMFWLGCSAMDSASLVVPITVMFCGLALLWAGAGMEGRLW